MNGILIIDKPQWYTSFDTVAKIRKELKVKRVGHTGTLDPMATGVLVVCVGEATKLVDELTCEDKIYRTTIKLGVKTDTGDMAGNICNGDHSSPQGSHLSDISRQKFESNVEYVLSLNQSFNYTEQQISDAIHSFIGKQKQIPPMYSSIKVDGKKLYEYARRGERVDVPPRDIEIYDIYDISFNGQDEISYTVHCSKGTYIRALNEDIASKLGTVGTTKELRRIKTGAFDINQAITLENVFEEKIMPIEKLFSDKIELEKSQESKLLNGINIHTEKPDGIYCIYIDDSFVGLGKVNNNNLKRFIII